MGERGSVIRELERLQEELTASKKESKDCQLLQREIAAALTDRDNAMKEVHELRRKLGLAEEDTGEFQSLGEASEEVARLRANLELLEGKLKDAALEADVAKGRRDWAFAERDKIMLESESVHSMIGQMRQERDRAVAKMADGLQEERRRKGSEEGNMGEVVDHLDKDCIVKQAEVHLSLEEHKIHGVILSEGVYVRALRPDSLAARCGKLAVGDRIVLVNGVEVGHGGLWEARHLLQTDKNLVLRTETLTCRTAGRAVERSASQSTPDRRPQREIMESVSRPAAASRLWASSERVYNISNNTVSTKEPKKSLVCIHRDRQGEVC